MRYFIRFFFLLAISFSSQIASAAADCIPARPQQQRLVNDFAKLMSAAQVQQLEQKLLVFNDTTSTQIAVVTVNTLCDYEPQQFAYEIGERWGVGDKKFNNGVVILVKPKLGNERGKVFIASGYGIEGVLPDATAKRIVEVEMLPKFKQNDYFGGISAAVNTVIDIAGGEYSAEKYNKGRNSQSFPLFTFLFLLFIIIVMAAGTFGRASKYAKTNNVGLLTALFLMGSMSGRHRGHYSNFSSGRGGFGGFGGGGGGFGGFGGGSFGGGGAGGSW